MVYNHMYSEGSRAVNLFCIVNQKGLIQKGFLVDLFGNYNRKKVMGVPPFCAEV